MNSEQFPKEFSPHIISKTRVGTDKFILVNQYRIHYVEAGEGDPVILIQGSFNTRRIWNRLVPLLSSNFRLLILNSLENLASTDQQGLSEMTLQDQTDLIAQMVCQIGFTRVNLIGGYTGGALVYDFATRYPDLVLKIISIEGSLVQPKRDLTTSIGTGQSKQDSHIPWFKINLSRRSGSENQDTGKSLKAPLLYLFGTKSDVKRIRLTENLEYLKTNLPLAWVVSLEGSIQDISLHQPAEIASIIQDFLQNKTETKNF